MAVEPVPGEPAAVADLPGGRALVVADYHAGLEVGLRAEGVELRSRARERRRQFLGLIDRTDPARVVVLGDLGDAVGDPGAEEREEIERFAAAAADRAPVTVLKGNHDGGIEAILGGIDGVEVVAGGGERRGDVGFAHGHTWPASAVLSAEVVCVAHEHPQVRLEDEVGGARTERAWLRGRVDPAPFEEYHGGACPDVDGELVVFPAFNDLVGGTWVNTEGGFLSPFLPDGLCDGEAYLLDGTRLGDYRQV